MKYEIEKTLVSSTCHITLKDNENLEVESESNTAPILLVYKYEQGFMIYINPNEEVYNDQDVKDNYSTQLRDLLLIAKQNGCVYLKLDCDGTVYEHLETFDW